MPKIHPGGNSRLAADYQPTDPADAREYAAFARLHLDPEYWPPSPRRRQRARGPSLARASAHARKVGADLVINRDGSLVLRFNNQIDLPLDASEWN